MLYFAYGSNMDPRQMRDRLGRDARRRRWARLEGYRLLFNKRSFSRPGSAAANIEPCPGSSVEGVLYEIDSEALGRLDVYEGCPDHYERRKADLAGRDGQVFAGAWIYIAVNPAVLAEGLRPFPEYLERLLAGGAENEGAPKLLSAAYLERLARSPTFAPRNRTYSPPTLSKGLRAPRPFGRNQE